VGPCIAHNVNVSLTVLFRSKKETDRLHRLNKPVRQASVHDDLPSLDSHDEENDSWSSGIDEDSDDLPDEDSDVSSEGSKSDEEMSYERLPRKRRPSWEPEDETTIQRLPIKSADGRVHQTGGKIAVTNTVTQPAEEKSDSDEEHQDQPRTTREDVSTGARFGRPAVVDVVGNKSRKARIQGAKEQIAGICQEIVADPENSVSTLFLKRTSVPLTFGTAWPSTAPTYFLVAGNLDPNSPRPCSKRSANKEIGHTLSISCLQRYYSRLPNTCSYR
jgi:nucleolar complex protein 3